MKLKCEIVVISNCTAPTWNGDLNFSKRGPNGDLILSEMGTKWGLHGDLNSVYLINGPKRANSYKIFLKEYSQSVSSFSVFQCSVFLMK